MQEFLDKLIPAIVALGQNEVMELRIEKINDFDIESNIDLYSANGYEWTGYDGNASSDMQNELIATPPKAGLLLLDGRRIMATSWTPSVRMQKQTTVTLTGFLQTLKIVGNESD